MPSALLILVAAMATLAAAWPRSRPPYRPRWSSPAPFTDPRASAAPTNQEPQPEGTSATEPETKHARPSGHRFLTKRVFKQGVEIDPQTMQQQPTTAEDDGIPWTAGGIYASGDDAVQPDIDDHVAAARLVEEFLLLRG